MPAGDKDHDTVPASSRPRRAMMARPSPAGQANEENHGVAIPPDSQGHWPRREMSFFAAKKSYLNPEALPCTASMSICTLLDPSLSSDRYNTAITCDRDCSTALCTSSQDRRIMTVAQACE